MRLTIRRLDFFSLGKIMGAMYGFFGLIFGAIFSMMALVGGLGGMASGEEGAEMIFFGVGAVIFLPIVYGVLGFIGGLLSAAIYNLAARFMGGMQMDVDGVEMDVEPAFR